MAKNSYVLDIKIHPFYPFHHPFLKKGIKLSNGNTVCYFKMYNETSSLSVHEILREKFHFQSFVIVLVLFGELQKVNYEFKVGVM